jgi:hypothetical protein
MQFLKPCILFFALIPLGIFAQKDTILPDRDVTIIGGKFEPNLEKAEKITVVPQQEPIDTKSPIFEYDIAKQEASTKRVATPLSPLSYKNKEKEDWRGNYFKAGYGNFNMPLVEAYLFNLKDDELIYQPTNRNLFKTLAKIK